MTGRPASVVAFLLAAFVLAAGLARPARGDSLFTFDDLNVSNEQSLPQSYGGLTWNNFQLMNTNWFLSDTGTSGYTNGTVSAPNVAWVYTPQVLSDTATATISSSSPFTFKSVDLAAAWNDGLNIQVQGYLKGQLVDSQTVVVNPSGPSLFAFNYQDIDTLKFVSSGGTFDPAYQAYASSSPNFVLDNLDVVLPLNTPEPSGLMLGGMFSVIYAWRRRRMRICA